MLRVTFLGTASSRPTVRRNVSSLMVEREGDAFLFDCGEGTQRQMMRYGVGFGVREIFVTHLHADHFLGITGLLQTWSLQGRETPVVVWGPAGSRATLRDAVELGGARFTFSVAVRELPAGEWVDYDGYRIEAFRTPHARHSVGFTLVEEERLGRFDPARADALGVPEGPLYGRLHRGEGVTLDDGRTISPDDVVGPARPGRRLVYTGDTSPADSVRDASEGADLLVHEATFGEPERSRALETGHSTARQAARIAAEADVRTLVLTHFSARYSEQPHRLRKEASAVFPGTITAEDGLTIEVPYPDQDGDTVLRSGGPGGRKMR